MQMGLYFFHFRWTWATKTHFCTCSGTLAECLRWNCWVSLPPPQPASELGCVLVLHRMTKSRSLSSFLSTAGRKHLARCEDLSRVLFRGTRSIKKKNKSVCGGNGCCHICCVTLTFSEFLLISFLRYAASEGRLWKSGHSGCVLHFNLTFTVILIKLHVFGDINNTRANCGWLRGDGWLQRVQLLSSFFLQRAGLCVLFHFVLDSLHLIASLSVWFSASCRLTCPQGGTGVLQPVPDRSSVAAASSPPNPQTRKWVKS